MEVRGRERLALAIASTLPAWAVLPAALSRRASDFAQFTDQAVLEIQVLHATRALHLLGPYSRYHWNHPGPILFYLMVPLYALSGHATRSIWISVWLLNVACIAAISWVASSGGRVHARVVFALLVWQIVCLGPANLCDPWGPYVVVLPFELCVFACVAVAGGQSRFLPLAMVVGTFAVQTNVGTLPAVVGALASGLACGLMSHRETGFRAWLRPAWISLAIAVVLWAPSIAEELRSTPGNITKLRDFFAGNEPYHPYGEVFRAVAEHLAAILHTDPDYRLHASESGVHEPTRAPLLAAKVLLAALPPTAVLAHARKHAARANGYIVAAATAASALYSATHVVGPLMSYLFMWTAGIGTLSLALVVAEWISPVIERYGRFAENANRLERPATFVVSTGALLYAHTLVPETPYFYGLPATEVRRLVEPLEKHLRDERLTNPVVRVGTSPTWGIMAGALLELYKDGVPFEVDREWLFMFGDQFRPNGQPDTFVVFGDASYEADARAVPGCLLLGQNADTYVFASPTRDLDDPCP